MKRRIVKGLLLLPALAILVLFLSAAATVIRENKDPEQAAPHGGRFVATRDAKVFCTRQGAENGTSVLLIHGTGAWGEIWRATTDALTARKFSVLTVDVP